jgi:hypothetical protein
MRWLPHPLPTNVRVVAATLKGPSLEELVRRCWPAVVVSGLTRRDRRVLTRRYLAQYGKRLPDVLENRLIESSQSANALFLRGVLEELRVVGSHDALAAGLRSYLRARTPDELYARILERYEGDYENNRSGLVRDAFSLLWASRRGLSESELLRVLRTRRNPLPRSYWSPLLFGADSSLLDRGGLLGFVHPYVREAVEAPSYRRPRRSAETRADRRYFAAEKVDRRALEELPWQRNAAGNWRQIVGVLQQLPFFAALWNFNAHDAKRYWARAKDAQHQRRARLPTRGFGTTLTRRLLRRSARSCSKQPFAASANCGLPHRLSSTTTRHR